MLIKEYRIPMPMSVEEYRIAQLYMIQVRLTSPHRRILAGNFQLSVNCCVTDRGMKPSITRHLMPAHKQRACVLTD